MAAEAARTVDVLDDPVPPGIRLGVVRGITYGLLGAAETFVPQARALGAGVVRVYLYWSQIEPEPGHFVWDAVDTLLAQLDGDEEVWITVCSTSMWGTRRKTDMLPPSPALDPQAYAAFVRRLVSRCRGRVTYWQCDNEPSVPILWAGTAEEYVAQLKVFARAVREADPPALVVLGGAPPNVFHADGARAHGMFKHIVEHARDDYDVFDIHLYGDPYEIEPSLAAARRMMAAAGYQKPVVAGEYNGPIPVEFREVAFKYLAPVLRAPGSLFGAITDDWVNRLADIGKPAPERDAMVALYQRMPQLPPQLQMFLRGCPPELEELRHRWNCRDIVVRNLLALAGGVRRTLCWNLGPEFAGELEPYRAMDLMFDKLKLMNYEGGQLAHQYPAARTLALTARMLHGATAVHRHEVPDHPELFQFEVRRGDRPALLVAWLRRDGLSGEDEPPISVSWPWRGSSAYAVDAYGRPVPVDVGNGNVSLPVSLTPIFVDQQVP